MKSLKYNILEDFMESIKRNEFEKEIELTNGILDLGITIEDSDSFYSNSILEVGSHLARRGNLLYTKSNLIGILPQVSDKVDKKDLGLFQILYNMESKDIHILNYRNDRRILYDVYEGQWKEVYSTLLKLIETDQFDELINKNRRKLDDMGLPLLIMDKEGLKWYRKMYYKAVSGIEKTIVYTNYNGLKIKHIYIGLDLQTGVPYLYINTNSSSEENNDRFSNYRKLFIPLGVISLLESIEEPLIVDINDEDLIYSGNMGKISGFEIGSEPDNKIFEFLRINNLYDRGSDVVSIEEIHEVNKIKNGSKNIEVESLKW